MTRFDQGIEKALRMLYGDVYRARVAADTEEQRRQERKTGLVPAFSLSYEEARVAEACDGFSRMARCRNALDALDRKGWKRSFHQRQFHDQFIRASARIFWKTEREGQFARDHKKILELNGWDSLPQELLVSTPRRFGKTISVSMFAAAMIYAAARVEVSIYSTCKRISQKLLRNIWKFVELIFDELGEPMYKIIRMNMEEVVLKGPEGQQDVRIVNSYPSKVFPLSPFVRLTRLTSPIAHHTHTQAVLIRINKMKPKRNQWSVSLWDIDREDFSGLKPSSCQYQA
jgi:hypothetical protein